jgi:fatty acid desaturase
MLAGGEPLRLAESSWYNLAERSWNERGDPMIRDTRTDPTTDHGQRSGNAEVVQHDDCLDFAIGGQRYPRVEIAPEIRRLSQVSNLRSVLLIASQWAVILGAGTIAVQSGHWAVYILAGALICSRQQALGILVHDATHYLLFTNRTVNDVVSDLFCAFPVGMSTTLYRHTHIQHHRFTNTEQDPDWVLQQKDADWRWPKTRREAWWLLIRSIFALNTREVAKAVAVWSPNFHLFDRLSPAFPLRARVLFLASTAVVFGAIYHYSLIVPALLLYTLPGVTLLNITNRMRATAEHILMPSTNELNTSRTVIPSLLERLFVAPLNINYHVEHHMFPSVPGCNLPKLHKRLMADPYFRENAHITHSYFGLRQGVLAEITKPDGEPAESTWPGSSTMTRSQ